MNTAHPLSGAFDVWPATLEEPLSSLFTLIYCRVNYTHTRTYGQTNTIQNNLVRHFRSSSAPFTTAIMTATTVGSIATTFTTILP